MNCRKRVLPLVLAILLALAASGCSAARPSAPPPERSGMSSQTETGAGAGADAGVDTGADAEESSDTGAGTGETSGTGAGDAAEENGILVAYFSLTGTTEEVARQIAGLTGGTLAEIQRAEEYGDLQEEAEAEILEGVRPEITVSVDQIQDYDTIFVGYPIWWNEAPAMIATFLESYDFSGKTIVPFCTSASDSIDNSLHIFQELCPDAVIAQGLTANDPADIEPWLQGMGLIQ